MISIKIFPTSSQNILEIILKYKGTTLKANQKLWGVTTANEMSRKKKSLRKVKILPGFNVMYTAESK